MGFFSKQSMIDDSFIKIIDLAEQIKFDMNNKDWSKHYNRWLWTRDPPEQKMNMDMWEHETWSFVTKQESNKRRVHSPQRTGTHRIRESVQSAGWRRGGGGRGCFDSKMCWIHPALHRPENARISLWKAKPRVNPRVQLGSDQPGHRSVIGRAAMDSHSSHGARKLAVASIKARRTATLILKIIITIIRWE